MELLLSRGARVNQQSRHHNQTFASALHVASRHCNHENVACLLRNGAQLELREGSGQTALHVAAAHDVTGQSAFVAGCYRCEPLICVFTRKLQFCVGSSISQCLSQCLLRDFVCAMKSYRKISTLLFPQVKLLRF